jgi:hypothetical protein
VGKELKFKHFYFTKEYNFRLLVPRQLDPAVVATVLHVHSQLFFVLVEIVLNSQLFPVVVATVGCWFPGSWILL